MKQLKTLSERHQVRFLDEWKMLQQSWEKIKDDSTLRDRFQDISYQLVVASWQGLLSQRVSINQSVRQYAVGAVDGSQIYYDRHQGTPCSVLNIGTVGLRYGYQGRAVYLNSEPFVFMANDDDGSAGDETLNLKRELYELRGLLEYSKQTVEELGDRNNYVAVCDGSLLFFYVDVKNKKIKTEYFDRYIDVLMQMHEQQILIVGYISFPKSKELVNVLRLSVAGFDESLALSMKIFGSFVDADVVGLFLQPGERTGLFQTKTSLVDLYPLAVKPYFCYLHVGREIVRLEFPCWIAQDEKRVDEVCAIMFDQATKGRGYPVCLFEAHEQAVIKAPERHYFYQLLQYTTRSQNMKYTVSQKQLKKQKPCI